MLCPCGAAVDYVALKIYRPYVLHAIVPRQKRRHEKGRRTREWGEFWLASFLDKVSVGDKEKSDIYAANMSIL